jgi:hypothetical protein
MRTSIMPVNPFVAAVVVGLAFPAAAHAYIDLGTGSYVLQIVAAAALGSLFTVKLYWKKLVSLFRGFLGRTRQQEVNE